MSSTPSPRSRSAVGAWVSALVSAPALALIRVYQLVLSPMRPPTCRFYPSCSAYALTAIERFGLVRGSWLATRRLLRCHPWNLGGVDHVPQAFGFQDASMSSHPPDLSMMATTPHTRCSRRPNGERTVHPRQRNQ